MNLVFKKYFWAVKLAGIALLALIIAGGINDWLGAKLFVVPKAPALDIAAPAGADEGKAWGRVAASEDAAAVLSGRRIFDLDPPSDEVAVTPPEPTEDEVAEEEPKDDGELEDTALAIDLTGTLVAADQASSMATLQVEGQNKIGWIGSEFLDGRAKIVKIAQRHVVIQEESRYTVVRMWADKSAGSARPGMPPGRPGIGRPTAVQPPPVAMVDRPSPSDQTQRANRIRDGIKKTGAYDFSVERKMLDEELKDLGKLQSEARVVPHYQNQKYEGFKLVGVRPGSLYRALGIRSGDVVKSVNGTAIDSPNKALELFNQLQNSSAIKVEIERRGQPQTLSYDIQ